MLNRHKTIKVSHGLALTAALTLLVTSVTTDLVSQKNQYKDAATANQQQSITTSAQSKSSSDNLLLELSTLLLGL